MIELFATETIQIGQETDLHTLGNWVRQYGTLAGMDRLEQTKLSTAASELARNMLTYAEGGKVQLDHIGQEKKQGVRLTFSDDGPGIADVDQAMEQGYSTGGGLGLGLPGAKKLASEFSLTSTVGVGTTIVILYWAHA